MLMAEAMLLSKQEEMELSAQLKESDLSSCCSTIRRQKADYEYSCRSDVDSGVKSKKKVLLFVSTFYLKRSKGIS